jgi:NAD(P)-dependent dehydrogenase (short-subunit alcohol dehydrogenase family)
MDAPLPTPALLKDQVALVTGGARGIGLEIARAFVAHGAKLVLNDLGCDRHGQGPDVAVVEQAARQWRDEGHQVLTHSGDVGDPEAVQSLFDAAYERFGRVDVLVNNAGIIADKNLFDLSLEAWDEIIRVHLRGTFLCTQAFARRARAQKAGGSIINLTSISGMLGNLGQINESSAKAGIYGLTRTASIELQRYRIRVNALAPIAKTRLTEDLPMFEKVSGSLEAEHIAPAALFLASQLSDDVSGTVLSVAG